MQKLLKTKKRYFVTILLLLRQLFIPLNLTLSPTILLQAALGTILWISIIINTKFHLIGQTLLALLFMALEIVLILPVTAHEYSLRSLLVLCLILSIVLLTLQQGIADIVEFFFNKGRKFVRWVANIGVKKKKFRPGPAVMVINSHRFNRRLQVILPRGSNFLDFPKSR